MGGREGGLFNNKKVLLALKMQKSPESGISLVHFFQEFADFHSGGPPGRENQGVIWGGGGYTPVYLPH